MCVLAGLFLTHGLVWAVRDSLRVPDGAEEGTSMKEESLRSAKMNLRIWPQAVSGRRSRCFYFLFYFVQSGPVRSVRGGGCDFK